MSPERDSNPGLFSSDTDISQHLDDDDDDDDDDDGDGDDDGDNDDDDVDRRLRR